MKRARFTDERIVRILQEAVEYENTRKNLSILENSSLYGAKTDGS